MKNIMAAWLMSCMAAAAFSTTDADKVYRQGLDAYPTNAAVAYGLFVQAVGEGSVEAIMAAAHCCEFGKGVTENRRVASSWRLRAMNFDAVAACRGMAEIDSLNHALRENDLEVRRSRFEANAADRATARTYVLQLLKDGRQAEAEDMLERTIVKFKPDARLLFERGVMARSRWDKQSAMLYFAGVLVLEDSSPRARAAQAAIQMDADKNVSEGYGVLRRVMEENPDDLFLTWLFAIQCRGQRRFAREGAAAYERILEEWKPGPVMVHHTYANILTESLGRLDDALVHRRIALEQAERAWTYQGLANTLMDLNQLEEAIVAYEKAVELKPEDPDYLRQYGRALLKARRGDEAVAIFEQLYALDPTDTFALMFKAQELRNSGRTDEVNTLFDRAAKMNPADSYPRSAMMLSALFGYDMEPDYERALELAKSLSKEKEFCWAHLIPCAYTPDSDVLYYTDDHRESMRNHLQQLAEGGSAPACFNLGMVYKEAIGVQPDFTQAEKWLTRAMESGHPGSTNELSNLRENGTVKNKEIRYAGPSAEAGRSKIMVEVDRRDEGEPPLFTQGLNSHYGRGGVEKNLPKALELYQLAIEKGDVRAYEKIGRLYWNGGEGVEKNAAKAIESLEKGYAAGHPGCATTLGILCYGGYGSPRQLELALKWLLISAEENDDMMSLNLLAEYYGANPDKEKNDPQLALLYADRLIAKKPSNGSFLGSAAAAYARAGKFDRAIELQKRCVRYNEKRFGGTKYSIHIERAMDRLKLYEHGKAYPEHE
ncbi:tetratricopeptide repeat protein [Pontiella sp.]|uniref:SEL1-like repeat protein n=1 Tax=Pontiella sp. TaxID=2837462 RepID=UPI0035635AF7